MGIRYNLYRFGSDEDAVAQLMSGRLPQNEQELYRMLQAPHYRINKLLAEHLLARDLLRRCRDQGTPFILFLRSFTAENKSAREGSAIGAMITADSKNLQDWLGFCLKDRGVPIIKLFGGSDALFGASSFPGMPEVGVLSAHARNWLEIASELASNASAIVFLISHLTPGVKLELSRIRNAGSQERSLIVLLDPQKTFSRDTNESIEKLRQEFQDFAHVFELDPPRNSRLPSAESEAFRTRVEACLHDPIKPAELQRSIDADFSYLDPDYFESPDYAVGERFLWQEMRRLRAIFHANYWEALKVRGLSFGDVACDVNWLPAHHIYGLALAMGDWAAIQEALLHLERLYALRRDPLAIQIQALRLQFAALAARCMPGGIPDTESRHTEYKEPLNLPPSLDGALKVIGSAQSAVENEKREFANYLYQVAVNLALASTNREEMLTKWSVSRMTHDWAQFQAGTTLQAWALLNYQFSLSLSRELAALDAGKYSTDVALCLTNLGALHFRRRDFDASEAAYREALEIRRHQPVDSEGNQEDLGLSLTNLGLAVEARGDLETARECFEEGIRVTATRLPKDQSAIVSLARLQLFLANCLKKMPGLEREAAQAFQAAEETIPKLAAFNPEIARQFETSLRSDRHSGAAS